MLEVRPFMSNQRSGSASYVGRYALYIQSYEGVRMHPYVSSYNTLYVQSYEGVRVHLMLAVRPLYVKSYGVRVHLAF